MSGVSKGARELRDAEKRFEFKAKGLYYDLRLISATNDDWQKWKDELLDMTILLFLCMYRLNGQHIRASDLNIFLETEQVEGYMYFRFFSDVGKVELIFELNQKTLEINYQRLEVTRYDEVFSLFA